MIVSTRLEYSIIYPRYFIPCAYGSCLTIWSNPIIIRRAKIYGLQIRGLVRSSDETQIRSSSGDINRCNNILFCLLFTRFNCFTRCYIQRGWGDFGSGTLHEMSFANARGNLKVYCCSMANNRGHYDQQGCSGDPRRRTCDS
jgi:hypothetical protein